MEGYQLNINSFSLSFEKNFNTKTKSMAWQSVQGFLVFEERELLHRKYHEVLYHSWNGKQAVSLQPEFYPWPMILILPSGWRWTLLPSRKGRPTRSTPTMRIRFTAEHQHVIDIDLGKYFLPFVGSCTVHQLSFHTHTSLPFFRYLPATSAKLCPRSLRYAIGCLPPSPLAFL